MPAPRPPPRPVPPRTTAAKPAAPSAAAPPPPPAPGTVKPSTRITAAKPPSAVARTAPPPPPPAQAKPGTAPVQRPGTAPVYKPTVNAASKAPTEAVLKPIAATRSANAKPATRPVRGQRASPGEGASGIRRTGLSKQQLIWIAAGGGVLVVGLMVLAMSWSSIQRSSQLSTLDACRDPAQVEQARALARAFADTWGPRSNYVADAIRAGRGPVEARIEMCRAGEHLSLLAAMMQDENLQPAHRGLICAALSEMWPKDGAGPAVTSSISSWALGPEADPVLSDPALRLMVAMATSEAPELLARGASDARLTPERALKIALGLGRVVDRQGNGVKPLLIAFGGAHRTVLLQSEQLQDVVRAQAMNSDLDGLYPLLDKPDTLLIGLAGLGSKRVQVSDKDVVQRQALVDKLKPLLITDSADPVLAAALHVVRRQRLIECRTQVLGLLVRLAKQRPPQLSADDLADLLGRSLIHTQTPEAAAAAEEMVIGLTAALDRDATRILAAVALSKVQEGGLESLRLALDELATYTSDDACAIALEVLIDGVYGRKDLIQTARKRGWGSLLADDRRKRGRYESIRTWLKEHGDETTVRSDKAVIDANRATLGKMRDELRAWMESSEPLPIGLSKAKLDELANQVQLMLNMVIKASSGG